jgi:glutamate/tyrosine decarboxylase-like PLP-dependent enzyme
MKKAGKDIHNPGPNVVFGANAQVALEKFARYFDVEARIVPVSVESQFVSGFYCTASCMGCQYEFTDRTVP